jgi:glycerate 2-kinase
MMLPEAFLTRTLEEHPYRGAVTRILRRAIQAVEPGNAVRQWVQRQGDVLRVGDQEYRLGHQRRIRVLGVGKAAHAMSAVLVAQLVDHSPEGLLILKHLPDQPIPGLVCLVGGHPVPDENSLRAGEKALQLVQGLNENDLVICLISGGGSALMSAPYAGITLAELQQLTVSLLACGARIDEINTLRRHLDRLKGGGLARIAAPARVVSLILSDVVGNPLEAIASGPTAPDPTTRAAVRHILEKYELLEKVPQSILQALENAPETPKPGGMRFERVQNLIVGSNQLAALAALQQAAEEGLQTVFLGDAWQGEAREVGKELCRVLKNSDHESPVCLVGGGETTVTVKGQPGAGAGGGARTGGDGGCAAGGAGDGWGRWTDGRGGGGGEWGDVQQRIVVGPYARDLLCQQ